MRSMEQGPGNRAGSPTINAVIRFDLKAAGIASVQMLVAVHSALASRTARCQLGRGFASSSTYHCSFHVRGIAYGTFTYMPSR